MKRIIYSLLFAAGTLFAGCSDDDTQAPLNTPIQEGNNLYGVVTDPNGAPVGGIVVSDGFSCVATDANGVYQMPRHADAFHVFYRIPADREIPMSEGRPCFWQRLSKTQERYDFVLMPQQAVETDFKLVCIADPQVQKDTDLARFKEESVPDIRAHVSTLEGPVYGITLGDIIFNERSKDVTNQMMPPIALAMRESEIGLKLFQVMGNHDNCMTPTVTDESSNFDLAGRRNFEYKFGPCDYSFDRGNAHIVAMDDVLLTDEKHNPSDYEGGFTDAQVEWLRQDLSLVPKEKLVIFCVHIPLRNATSFNRETVRNLLKEFDNVHIMPATRTTPRTISTATSTNISTVPSAAPGGNRPSTSTVPPTVTASTTSPAARSRTGTTNPRGCRRISRSACTGARRPSRAATSSPTRPPTRSWPTSGTRTTGTGRSKCMKTATKPAR